MLQIRSEIPADHAAIEALLDRCFGEDRFRKTSYRYRRGVACIRELCLVGEIDGAIVGTIRYWPVLCGSKPALLLGPLGIEPRLQGQGIGRTLANHTLSAAFNAGVSMVFLVGDPGYYTRFQFATTPPNISMPGESPLRLQYRILGSGRLPEEEVTIEPWPQSTIELAGLMESSQAEPGMNDAGVASRSGMIAEPAPFN